MSDALDPLTYLPLAHKLAYQIQWQEEDHEDLVQEGMAELCKWFAIYQSRGTELRNPKAVAGQIMARWMKWWYKPKDRGGWELTADPITMQVEGGEDHFEERYFREFFRAARDMVGEVEAAIAEQLLFPGAEVYFHARVEQEGKRRRKERGEAVRGADTLVIKHEHIRKALDLGEYEWERRLLSLRRFTREFLGKSRHTEMAQASGHGF